jgi:hypothetical protein
MVNCQCHSMSNAATVMWCHRCLVRPESKTFEFHAHETLWSMLHQQLAWNFEPYSCLELPLVNALWFWSTARTQKGSRRSAYPCGEQHQCGLTIAYDQTHPYMMINIDTYLSHNLSHNDIQLWQKKRREDAVLFARAIPKPSRSKNFMVSVVRCPWRLGAVANAWPILRKNYWIA